MLIGGERVAGGGEALAVENPYTEETIATVGAASPEQTSAAIAAAREAWPAWGTMPAGERCELLHEVARRLREHQDELAALMTAEGGKPLVENSRRDRLVRRGLRLLRRDRPRLGRPGDPADRVQPARAGRQGPARASSAASCPGTTRCCCWPGSWRRRSRPGNTVVCKPSELTPLSTLALAPLLDHLPAGVVNMLAGAGRDRRRADRGRARRLHRLHRLGRDRQAGGARLRRAGRAGQPRDGRQGPVHRLRRRRFRRGPADRRTGRRLGRLPERGPGLHLGRALLRDRGRLRRLRQRLRRSHADPRARRPDRARHRPRADGLRGPARQGRRPGRGRGRGRRRAARRRRQRRSGAGPLLRSGGGHRRRGRDRPAARGDLRPGRADRPGQEPRRGDRARQRDRVRARRQRLHARPGERRCGACASCAPAPSGSTTR